MDSDNMDFSNNRLKNNHDDMSLNNSQMALNYQQDESTSKISLNQTSVLEQYEIDSPDNVFKRELKPLGEKTFQIKKLSSDDFEAETDKKLIMENIDLGSSGSINKADSLRNSNEGKPGLRKSSDYDSTSLKSEEDLYNSGEKDEIFEDTMNPELVNSSTSSNKQAQSKISIRKFNNSHNKLNPGLTKYKDDYKISEADEYLEQDHEDNSDKTSTESDE